MRDVAVRAGVGVGTVSRVVNQSEAVTSETRARVEKAIAETGFQRNEAARMLRPGQSSTTIGLIIDDLQDPFAAAIASGAVEVVNECGHVLLVGATRWDPIVERGLTREFIRRQVDGLLIVSSDRLPIGEADQTASVPVVYLDRAPRGSHCDRVLLDNHNGVKAALSRLLDAGHRRIAYIGGSPRALTGSSRLQSYKKLLRQHGILPDPTLITMRRYTTEEAREAAFALLHVDDPPTAIFADNHRLTLGAAQVVTDLGIKIALAGIDDLDPADLLPFEIDLVAYPASELGRRGAEQLFHRIDGDTRPATTLRVSTNLIRRGRPLATTRSAG